MKTVKVIAPATEDCPGSEHTIPESDLQSFLDNGWRKKSEKGDSEAQDEPVNKHKK